QALREAGEILDPNDGDARRRDARRRGAGGHDRDAGLVQPTREIDQAGLVVDTDESAPDRHSGGPGGFGGSHRGSSVVIWSYGIETLRPVIVQPSRASRPT